MNRSIFGVLVVSLSLTSLVGCSGGPESDEQTETPAGDQAKGTKDSEQPSDSTDPAEEKDKGSSVGPQCEAYLDCCDEIAKDQPALAGSCDTTRKSVDDAIDKGASTETYESSCKQALATMQSAGYCK